MQNSIGLIIEVLRSKSEKKEKFFEEIAVDLIYVW